MAQPLLSSSRKAVTCLLMKLRILLAMLVSLTLFGLALRGQITEKNPGGVQLVSWYWHFVDAVWIVVFLIVYVGAKLGTA